MLTRTHTHTLPHTRTNAHINEDGLGNLCAHSRG